MPGFPVAERQSGPLADAPLGQLIAKVEARLRAEPRDGDGWAVIAPVYFKLGRYKDAANAYAHAAEIKGETVERLAGFADATVRAADGIVTEDARLAFQKILKLAPGQPQARFWLALAREQDGQVNEALAEYKAIVAAGPADAPWRPGVEQHIAEVSRRLAGADEGRAARPDGAGHGRRPAAHRGAALADDRRHGRWPRPPPRARRQGPRRLGAPRQCLRRARP